MIIEDAEGDGEALKINALLGGLVSEWRVVLGSSVARAHRLDRLPA